MPNKNLFEYTPKMATLQSAFLAPMYAFKFFALLATNDNWAAF